MAAVTSYENALLDAAFRLVTKQTYSLNGCYFSDFTYTFTFPDNPQWQEDDRYRFVICRRVISLLPFANPCLTNWLLFVSFPLASKTS